MEDGGGMKNFSREYLAALNKIMSEFPHFYFERLIEAFLKAYLEERQIFVMGNGGSSATASHWACDINKGCCLHHKKKFKMICLNDNISTILAYANDLSYDQIFVEQLKNLFSPGDLVIGISGSGNSNNVLEAINYANDNGGITAGLCGFSGGKLRHAVHIPVLIRAVDMQKIEDMHIIVAHMSMQRLAKQLTLLSEMEGFQARSIA
jgi:D-sedoheptulose 7-phosphate isomerase